MAYQKIPANDGERKNGRKIMKFKMVTTVNCQAEKELNVNKPTQLDEDKYESVLDVMCTLPTLSE